MHIGTEHPVPGGGQVAGGVQDRFVGATPGPGDDPRVEDDRNLAHRSPPAVEETGALRSGSTAVRPPVGPDTGSVSVIQRSKTRALEVQLSATNVARATRWS